MPPLVKGLLHCKPVVCELLVELVELGLQRGVLAGGVAGRFRCRCAFSSLALAICDIRRRREIIQAHYKRIIRQHGHQVFVILDIRLGDLVWQRLAALHGASD